MMLLNGVTAHVGDTARLPTFAVSRGRGVVEPSGREAAPRPFIAECSVRPLHMLSTKFHRNPDIDVEIYSK
jgi:hypothetical protein